MPVTRSAIGRRRGRLALAGLALALGVALASSTLGTTLARAADDPCAVLDSAEVARLLGPTGAPTAATVDGRPACSMAAGPFQLTASTGGGGAGEFDRLRANHPRDAVQDVDDYVDGAFFGWGVDGALEFVTRRGDLVVRLQLVGSDPAGRFDAADPASSSPGGDLRGAAEPSALWALTTGVLARQVGPDAQAAASDLSGIWRTDDISACGGPGVTTRLSRFDQHGGSLQSTKVAGDACLADARVDFSGTIQGKAGRGRAFGTIGSTSATTGVPYRIAVLSPTAVRLTGTAGSLQYTRDYQRLSWPGLKLSPHPSALLGIPGPSEALTARNIGLSSALSVLLLLLVVFPTAIFNAALDRHLDRDSLGRRWLTQLRLRREPGGSPGLWNSRPAVVGYLLVAAFVFSLVQPGWGANTATITSFAGFLFGVSATAGVGLAVAQWYAGRGQHPRSGRSAVEPGTLGIALLCVAGSRMVGFLPGYMYGVLLEWEVEEPWAPTDRARMAAISASLSLVLSLLVWWSIPVLDDVAAAHPAWWTALPAAVAGGMLVATVQDVMISLIPLRLLPGNDLRQRMAPLWALLWGFALFLFVLTLLHPGLVDADSRSIFGTLLLAAVCTGAALLLWAREGRRSVTPPPSPPPGGSDLPEPPELEAEPSPGR